MTFFRPTPDPDEIREAEERGDLREMEAVAAEVREQLRRQGDVNGALARLESRIAELERRSGGE